MNTLELNLTELLLECGQSRTGSINKPHWLGVQAA